MLKICQLLPWICAHCHNEQITAKRFALLHNKTGKDINQCFSGFHYYPYGRSSQPVAVT